MSNNSFCHVPFSTGIIQSYVMTIAVLQMGNLISAANLTQVQTLYADILSGYNRNLLPVLDDNTTVTISANISILSINDFDEISGKLEITFWFQLEWTEERITWNSSDYGMKSSMHLPTELIWTPPIYLRESSFQISAIGMKTKLIRIYSDGKVTWDPAEVIYGTCSVNVEKFPYDTQTCILLFSPWHYIGKEITLSSGIESLQSLYFAENSEWILLPSEILSCNATETISCIQVNLKLKRRYEFYEKYLLLPLAFLAFLNKLVFFMPANSGERMSVAVTIFLSFVVFMDIINDNVPASSNPVAYIYVWVLLLMLYSLLILLFCIVSLRIYDQNKAVPVVIQKIVALLRLWCFRNMIKKTKITHLHVPSEKLRDNEEEPIKSTPFKESIETISIPHSGEVVTWTLVGKTFDIYCYFLMLIFLLIVSVNMIVIWRV